MAEKDIIKRLSAEVERLIADHDRCRVPCVAEGARQVAGREAPPRRESSRAGDAPKEHGALGGYAWLVRKCRASKNACQQLIAGS